MMKTINKISQIGKTVLSTRRLLLLFIGSFLIWVFYSRGFLFGPVLLSSDAQAYYGHFNFYINNLLKGIYPLWDPSRDGGIPAEFFLRRIGSFNPFFSFLVFLRMVGVPFSFVYPAFLVFYFFLGMVGFYLVAKHLLRDSRMAFAAYLLLMFSSLGVRMFDSYIMFTFVPMVWFFYFLLAFTEKQEKHLLLGLTLTLMILFSTYIPFYFLTILLCFLICFFMIYSRALKSIFRGYLRFLKAHKIFVCLCFLAVVLSLVPHAMFYLESGKGEMVMPYRHTTSAEKNELAVGIATITRWAIAEDIVFSGYGWGDLREIRLALLYIPNFIYILLCLGMITRVNKKLILLLVWGGIILLIGWPSATPLYEFLFKFVPYFKYFRNLHFFLWFLILPALVLFAVLQFQAFLQFSPRTKGEKRFLAFFIIIVYVAFGVFLCRKMNALPSSCLMIGLSLVLFLFYFLGPLRKRPEMFLTFLFVLIIIEPAQVYHYLTRNSERANASYQFVGEPWGLVVPERPESKGDLPKNDDLRAVEERYPRLYFTLRWFDFLYTNLQTETFAFYYSQPLIVYDRVEYLPDNEDGAKKFAEAIVENRNTAFVAPDQTSPKNSFSLSGAYATHPQKIYRDSQDVRLLGSNVNSLKLKTSFLSKKFLVYNDNFHHLWQVFINGKPAPLYRANMAFKGVWVPAGENIVYFRFGGRWRPVMNFFLLAVFYAVFLSLLFLSIKASARRGKPNP